jgi:hypothetical protein
MKQDQEYRDKEAEAETGGESETDTSRDGWKEGVSAEVVLRPPPPYRMFVRRFSCIEDGLIDSTRGTSRIIVTWLKVGLTWEFGWVFGVCACVLPVLSCMYVSVCNCKSTD